MGPGRRWGVCPSLEHQTLHLHCGPAFLHISFQAQAGPRLSVAPTCFLLPTSQSSHGPRIQIKSGDGSLKPGMCSVGGMAGASGICSKVWGFSSPRHSTQFFSAIRQSEAGAGPASLWLPVAAPEVFVNINMAVP